MLLMLILTATPEPLSVLPPDITAQIATLAGLAAPLIVSAIRRRLAGRPKWVLPALCIVLALVISIGVQIVASLTTAAEMGGWAFYARTAVGLAVAGLGLLLRELRKSWRSGEVLDDRPKVRRAMDRLGRYRGGGKLGIILATMLLPAVAHAEAPRDASDGAVVLILGGIILLVVMVDLLAQVWQATRGRRGGLALAALLLLPAVAEAQQPLGQGVGFPVDRSWSVGFRGCGTHSVTDPSRNPWAATGLDVTLNCCPASWTTAQRESYRRAYCEWMGDAYVPPEQRDGSASCECVFGGPIGGYPHGVGRYEDLVRYGEIYGTGGLPSAVEMDLLYRSDAAVLWLWQQLCQAGEQQACLRLKSRQSQGPCPNGWRCDDLSLLPPSERPGAIGDGGRVVRVTRATGSTTACSFFSVTLAKLYVRQDPRCFALMPDDCQTVSTLRPECWEPPAPICGDGTCDANEDCSTCSADCGPCEPPPTGGLVIAITPIETGWEVEWEVDGETGTSTTAAPGTVRILPGDVTLSLPAVPAGDCPERAVLEAVRAVEGVCEP